MIREESEREKEVAPFKYDNLTVAELKEELKKRPRPLTAKGRKSELVRILQSDDHQQRAVQQAVQGALQGAWRAPFIKDDQKRYEESIWIVAEKVEDQAWDLSEMEKNLTNFKQALVGLSDGYRVIDVNLPPLKIQVDRYKDEWLRWDMYMGAEDFHHDIFLKIDDPVINVYNVLGVRKVEIMSKACANRA